MPRVTFNATDPSTETGCNAKVRPEPPTRTLAPTPDRHRCRRWRLRIRRRERRGRAGGGREHGPAEHTTGADPDIEPHRIERTFIGLRGKLILGKSAFHCLVPGNDEADAWIKPAAQHADLRPRGRGCATTGAVSNPTHTNVAKARKFSAIGRPASRPSNLASIDRHGAIPSVAKLFCCACSTTEVAIPSHVTVLPAGASSRAGQSAFI